MNDTWTQRPLGELFEIGAGKTMSAAARAGQNKVPFLRTSNVFWDRLDFSAVDEMSIRPNELPDKLLEAGDLLVCEGGEIGRAAIWDGSIAPMSFQNHLHRLRPKVHDVDPRFYVYFLQAAFTQLGIFEGAGNKTTIPNLSSRRLAALEVPHPPLSEQSAIVDALALIREALKIQEDSLAAADSLRTSTMLSVYSKGLNGESTKLSQLGDIPESWSVIEFSQLRESLRYGTSQRCSATPATYPVLRIPNILSARIDAADLKYCDLTDKEAARYGLEDGDLIFIRTNGVIERLGLCAVYRGNPDKALYASYLIRARLLDGVDPDFVAYFMGSPVGIDQIGSRATPAADGKFNLNTGIIDSLLVPLPQLREQQEIAAVLRTIDQKLDLHRTKLVRLNELYQRMLYDLMTGAVLIDELAVPTRASAGGSAA
ncbi:restriction endonuclease subunit S [Nocardia brevicatena]|uniref:restriction endonuclease subunit S n=1 Tax=Nocardia brevicatena TaxID=37327 RepID=UPI0005953F5F|nr:restriction endonuclease subunit S [Nocardia brevicatena]